MDVLKLLSKKKKVDVASVQGKVSLQLWKQINQIRTGYDLTWDELLTTLFMAFLSEVSRGATPEISKKRAKG